MTITVWPANAVTGAPSYSGRMLRQANSTDLVGATAARPLGARSGVRPGTSTTTVTATSTTWTVAPHAGVLDLQSAAEAGPYRYASDANATGSVTAANATNPRVDIIYVRVDDPAESDGTSVPAVAFGYLAGTAAPSPSAPATPARSMVLATIAVPASGGGSPTVTWVAPYSVAAGAPIPVRSQAERDAITWGTSECPAQVYRLDKKIVETNTGSGWSGSTIGPWVTYTPTVSGVSLGTGGTATAVWRYEGDLVRVRPTLTWGTGASGSQPRFTLPVTSAALRHAFEVVGTGSLSIAGGAQIWKSVFVLASTTQAQINYETSGALLDIAIPSTPASWASGDVMTGEFTYRIA